MGNGKRTKMSVICTLVLELADRKITDGVEVWQVDWHVHRTVAEKLKI
jgi:hypothetical protein